MKGILAAQVDGLDGLESVALPVGLVCGERFYCDNGLTVPDKMGDSLRDRL